MQRRGFTLIEVLVVIVIVAILASISTAVFIRAKESGKQITCTENLKQIATSTQIYSQAYDGLIPNQNPGIYATFGAGGAQSQSKDILAPYGVESEQYRCGARAKDTKLLTDYVFRYSLHTIIPPSTTYQSYIVVPEPTTVLAWDWNHGVKDDMKQADPILFTRSDTSIGRTRWPALKQKWPNADGTWGDVQTVKGSQYEFAFPGEDWPPGIYGAG